MKLVLLSDTHNYNERIEIPDADILIHAGDLTNRGTEQEIEKVASWFAGIHNRYKAIIFTPGNHDWLFEEHEKRARYYFHRMPNVHCLINQGITIDGKNFWGTPVTRRFYDWAFNISAPDLKDYWNLIPDNTNILITHQPPYGIGDELHEENLGCPLLAETIRELQPDLHVYGHIHNGAGTYQCGRTRMVNAAIVDERYALVNKPIVIEI